MEITGASKSVFLIGRKKRKFDGRMLPSKKEVFSRLFYLIQDEKKNVKESVFVVTNELIQIYNFFNIPTKRKDGVNKIIFRNYNDYNYIRKKANSVREKDFVNSLDELFDISHIDAINLLQKDKKQQQIEFLNDHRKSLSLVRQKLCLGIIKLPTENKANSCNNAMEHFMEVDTDTDSQSDGSEYLPPNKKRSKVSKPVENIIEPGITQALDRFQVSNTGAAIIIGQTAYNLGYDVTTLNISPEFIRLQRLKYRETIFQNIKKEFPINSAFTVHWDGKVLEDCTSMSRVKCNRLAIILSACGNTKVLGVPKVEKQTGAIEGDAVYLALQDWNVQNNVMAMCFDTTSSNTSSSVGACAVLEQKLDRHLLYLACRHHIMELLAGAAFKVTIESTTSGPKISLFEKFRITWPQLQHDNFDAGILDPDIEKHFPAAIRNEIVKFIKDQIENKVDSTRHDYIEMLKLGLIFLGEKIPNYKISQPGAISHARWMAKVIYSLKIFLFRKQFNLSAQQLENIRRFNIFAVRIYIKYWFLCQVAPKAPANDLLLLKELEVFKMVDEHIGVAVQNKLLRHLWYLNESNIAFAFFDDNVDVHMKKKMVDNLKRRGHPDKPKRATFPAKDLAFVDLSDFVTTNTYFFFDTLLNQNITGISPLFLKTDPITWETNDEYLAAKEIVKKILVVNDIAERGVALITRFNTVLTHQEEQKQFVLHTMEQHYKDLPSKGFSKQKFVEYLENNFPKEGTSHL